MNNDKVHSLELSLTIGCRLDCDYCPQRLLLAKYYDEDKTRARKLSFENFKIVLDKVHPGATLSFCGMSEPFHNEACADMIVYAYERGYKICLNTTLVGMTVSDFEKIKNVQFENFILHIPDKENHSKFVITDEYLELLKLVNDHIKVDYYSCHGEVHEAIENIIDKEKYAGISLGNRAGNLEIADLKEVFHKGKIICYHGSEKEVGGWMPVMFPDGRLVLCCQDYGMKHVLGNLITESWSEICNGDEYKRFKKGMEDESVDILCRKCSDAKQVEALPSMQLKKAVSDVKNGVAVSDKIPEAAFDMVDKFAKADHVCVFGLGKFWRDHFLSEYWNAGLGVTLFSDNNPELQNTEVNGITCVKPEELINYENLLVVLFVKNGDAIISQLNKLGIDNCILIDEVFEKSNLLCNKKFKKMTLKR